MTTTLRAELLEARTDATLRLEAMRTLRAELDAARLERDEIREDAAACRAALASEHERAERAEKVLATVYAAVDEQGGYLHDANGNLAKAVSAVGKDLRFNIEKRTAAEAAWKDDEAKGMEREASLDAALSTSHAEVDALRPGSTFPPPRERHRRRGRR